MGPLANDVGPEEVEDVQYPLLSVCESSAGPLTTLLMCEASKPAPEGGKPRPQFVPRDGRVKGLRLLVECTIYQGLVFIGGQALVVHELHLVLQPIPQIPLCFIGEDDRGALLPALSRGEILSSLDVDVVLILFKVGAKDILYVENWGVAIERVELSACRGLER